MIFFIEAQHMSTYNPKNAWTIKSTICQRFFISLHLLHELHIKSL
jgi:hypothetical protein